MRRIFETGLEKIGRIISAQYNINVIFEGSQAKTDGKTIYLPSTQELSPELMEDLNGFLDHEVGHCRYTDFGQFQNLLEGRGREFQKNLLNAVEDVRIEREIIAEFPGCRLNLDPLNKKLKDNLLGKWTELPVLLRFIIGASFEMDGTAYDKDDELNSLVELCQDLFDKFNDAKSTDELRILCEQITQRIIEYIDEEKGEGSDDENEGDENGEGENDGDGGGGSGEGDSDSDNGSEGESESVGGSGSGGGSASGLSPEERERANRMLSEGDCNEWNEPTTIDEMIKQKVEEFCQSNPAGFNEDGVPNPNLRTSRDRRNAPHIPVTTRFDTENDYTGKGDAQKYNILKAKIRPQVASIKYWFEKVLKVQENLHWRTERERGMVNGRSLNRLATDPNYRTPFKSQHKTATNNVAVEILIDLSASMGGTKIETAKLTAIAMAEALNSLMIPFEITGWNSCPDRHMAREFKNADRSIFNRTFERLNKIVFKRFDSSVLNGLEKIKIGVQNPDGEAVKWAANRLSIQKQNRKILFVLSDGYPCTQDGDNRILNNDLDLAIKKVKRAGIEIVGIGIESSAVKDFYPDYLVINDVKDLPKGALQKLAKIITKAS